MTFSFPFLSPSLQQSYAPPPPPMAPPSPGTTGGGGGGGGGHGGGLVEQLSKTNLYIRGLPPATTDQDLIKLCQPWVLLCSIQLNLTLSSLCRCILQCSWALFSSACRNSFCVSPTAAYNEDQQFALDLSVPLLVLPQRKKHNPAGPNPSAPFGTGSSTHMLHKDTHILLSISRRYKHLSLYKICWTIEDISCLKTLEYFTAWQVTPLIPVSKKIRRNRKCDCIVVNASDINRIWNVMILTIQ